MKKQLTLVMIVGDGKVLLGMKKRGFGAGRWNGFGGKVESGETIEQAALREIAEEVTITPKDLEQVGVLEFSFKEDETEDLEVHVFKAESFDGDPTETDEMAPEWFSYDEIPYGQMWPDDEHWLPFLLTNRTFKGRFVFDKPSSEEHVSKILDFEMDAVDSLVSQSEAD